LTKDSFFFCPLLPPFLQIKNKNIAPNNSPIFDSFLQKSPWHIFQNTNQSNPAQSEDFPKKSQLSGFAAHLANQFGLTGRSYVGFGAAIEKVPETISGTEKNYLLLSRAILLFKT